MSNKEIPSSWIEISKSALKKNVKLLESVIGPKVTPSFCVKANAYGHGAPLVGALIEEYMARAWLGVHSIEEAHVLRAAGIKLPLYIMGALFLGQIAEAIKLNARFVVCSRESIQRAEREAALQKKVARIHIKVETGNHRLGVEQSEVLALCKFAAQCKHLRIEGLSTHFSNIEDLGLSSFKNIFSEKKKSGDHMSLYPAAQLETFTKVVSAVRSAGFTPEKIHAANSAATLLFPETHFSMVRPGLALYGMWPSSEVQTVFEKKHPGETLTPVLEWKTRISQLKTIEKGKYIGYGCTYKTKRTTRLGIIPVGYADGFSRSLSNKGYVIINGEKAPVRGRVCMNMTMIDCTNIPGVQAENEVRLIGEKISADDMAKQTGRINYQITTELRESIPRLAK